MAETRRSRRSNQAIGMQVPEGQVVGEFEKYQDAVDCVDALIRHDFPAASISIVGAGLRSVERVRVRLGYGRIAIRGIVQGSWLGLIFWVFFGSGNTSSTSDLNAIMDTAQQNLLPSILIGAGIGMLYQILAFSFGRKKREFLSQTSFVAANYEVVVPNQQFELAKLKLEEHRTKCTEDKN